MEKKKEYVLEVEDLTVYYEMEKETVKAVNGISFKLEKGKTLGLVGETGSGKTTTALSLLHLIPDPPGVIKSGKIMVCGHDMRKIKPSQLTKVRGKDISMIFQDPMTSLDPVFPVVDQIMESIILHEEVTKQEAYEKAVQMLELVGIPEERAHEYPHQFSGGMKQRVVIAIALACNPHILIADEPTTALDVTIQAQVLELMKELRNKYQTSMIMITHDLGIIAEVCDEVAVVYAGSIVEKGSIRDVFKHTRHPYTEGLFNSIPDINNRKSELKPIPGLMPDPTDLPKGCPFAPRCVYATAECSKKKPTMHQEGDHVYFCSAYDDPKFKIEKKDS